MPITVRYYGLKGYQQIGIITLEVKPKGKHSAETRMLCLTWWD
jgi:hypothetical protein